MATLTINFTPVPGITSYTICYKPSDAVNYTCIEDSQSPVVITAGIECGVRYDVTVATNCPAGEYATNTSVPVTYTTLALDCPPPPTPCLSYTVATTAAQAQTIDYTNCDGTPGQISIGGVSGYDATTFCALEGSVGASGETWTTVNGPCGEPKTINVSGAYGTMEPCIGGTIDDFMSASVNLDNTVSVDTIFQVDVYWSERNSGGCAYPNTQSFWIPVKAGQSSGSLNACTNGAYFPSGADICSAAVVSHDNTVDTINL
jgi:hypothetical protein